MILELDNCYLGKNNTKISSTFKPVQVDPIMFLETLIAKAYVNAICKAFETFENVIFSGVASGHTGRARACPTFSENHEKW